MLKKKSSDNKDEDLKGQNDRAQFKFERLTHFLLNIDKIQMREFFPEKSNLAQKLLEMSLYPNM